MAGKLFFSEIHFFLDLEFVVINSLHALYLKLEADSLFRFLWFHVYKSIVFVTLCTGPV